MDTNTPENMKPEEGPKNPANQSVGDFGTQPVQPQSAPEKPAAPQKPEVPAQAPAAPAAAPTPPAPTPAAPPVKPSVKAPAQPKPAPAAPTVPPVPPAAKPTPTPPAAKPTKQVPAGKRVLSKEEVMQREASRNKKIIMGCGGSFGCATILLIVLIFVFVGQGAAGSSALAGALNLDQASLVNTLITIVNLFFGLGAFITFIMAIGGIFKAVMARKDDSVTKKKGYILSGASFGILIVIIMLWIGAWYYLNEQRGPSQPQTFTTIQTTPSETLNLTAPIEIKFDASQLPYDSKNYDIISYFWDFGDGTAGAGSNVETHTYERKGSGRYDVKLTLTFKNKTTGEEATDSVEHVVTIADEKVAAILEADVESGTAPLTVEFDGSKSTDPDGTIETYAWEIDGGGFEEGDATYTYTFEQVGDYTVRLRVTNNKGDYDIAEKIIKVEQGDQPLAVIEILNAEDDKYYVDQTYTFDASKSSSPAGAITKYEWDFGDGSSKKSTRTAQHAFSTEGVYKVILVVTDEKGNQMETTKDLNVTTAASAPSASMKTDPAKENPDDISIQGTIPFEVNFDATGSTDPDDDIVDYKWDFDGDDEFDATGETTAWVFNEPGSYNVKLTVIDSAGFESRDVLLVKALSRGLEPLVVANPVSGVVPLTVEFDATGSTYSDGQIVSYEWDFGDGTLPRSDVGKVTYKYTKIGNFTATVKIRTNDGKEEQAEILISVRQVPLKSCFEPSQTVGNAPLVITFNPQCSTGTIAKYKWDFGDGETSAERKPTYTYSSPGSYEVVLEVSDAQNVVDVSSQFITVTGELTAQ